MTTARRPAPAGHARAEAEFPRQVIPGDRQSGIATWCEAGLLLSDLQQHERAVAFLERAVDADPQGPSLRGSLGWALLRFGAYERSLALSDEALAGDPKLTWVLRNRGLALLALGRTKEGLAAYSQAVESQAPGDDFADDIRLLQQFVDGDSRKRPGLLLASLVQVLKRVGKFGERRTRGEPVPSN